MIVQNFDQLWSVLVPADPTPTIYNDNRIYTAINDALLATTTTLNAVAVGFAEVRAHSDSHAAAHAKSSAEAHASATASSSAMCAAIAESRAFAEASADATAKSLADAAAAAKSDSKSISASLSQSIAASKSISDAQAKADSAASALVESVSSSFAAAKIVATLYAQATANAAADASATAEATASATAAAGAAAHLSALSTAEAAADARAAAKSAAKSCSDGYAAIQNAIEALTREVSAASSESSFVAAGNASASTAALWTIQATLDTHAATACVTAANMKEVCENSAMASLESFSDAQQTASMSTKLHVDSAFAAKAQLMSVAIAVSEMRSTLDEHLSMLNPYSISGAATAAQAEQIAAAIADLSERLKQVRIKNA